jgi:hypothetical protein
MLEDNQNKTRKKPDELNVTKMRTQQLSDSYCTESSAPSIEVVAICNLSNIFVTVLIACPSKCRVTVNIELN